jgi:hypothetical protein
MAKSFVCDEEHPRLILTSRLQVCKKKNKAGVQMAKSFAGSARVSLAL